MKIRKHDIPVVIDAPGARARALRDFGTARGPLSAEYFSLGAGTDIAPLLQGLVDNLCHSPHWGYVLTGELKVTYGDGTVEECRGGDVYYWPPGHTLCVVEDTELVMFSPQVEHGDVMDHMLEKIAAASS